jgi:hypothetical protein
MPPLVALPEEETAWCRRNPKLEPRKRVDSRFEYRVKRQSERDSTSACDLRPERRKSKGSRPNDLVVTDTMLEKSMERLIWFGTALRYLQDARTGYSIKSSNGWAILDNLRGFLSDLEELGLAVTSRAARDLRRFTKELEESSDDHLSDAQATRLTDMMDTIRPTLEAEARGFVEYIVSERRFRSDYLIKRPSALFASGVYDKLPKLAQLDFAEAGKCLAFERPTAAAFHMLRGTESTLRNYYCEKVRRKRSVLMWGPMIESMRSMPRRFPEVLLNHLDHIRTSFRNPTAHPEKIYDIDEAQDLLSICIDVCNRMVQGASK